MSDNHTQDTLETTSALTDGLSPEIRAYVDERIDHLKTELVQHVADCLNLITVDPRILSTLSANVLALASRAVRDQAATSENRVPKLRIINGYVPGSARVMIHDNGQIRLWTVKPDDKGEAPSAPTEYDWQEEDDTFALLGNKQARDGLITALITQGCEPDKCYYLTTDLEIEGIEKGLMQAIGRVTAS